MVIQIYLPCFYGTEISIMSEKLTTSLFHSEWYLGNRSFRTLILIFMEFAKRPIEIMAMGVFIVNLETFTAICNSAYSLFAILKDQ